MANSNRNSLRKSRITEDRNQRQEAPVQAGARSRTKGMPPEKANNHARHRLGKTSKHT